MARLFFVLLLCCCGDTYYVDGDCMSTYPPDGWEIAGTDVTWASDFDIQNGIGDITAIADNGSYIDITTSTAHGLEVGQWVRISDTTDYDGEYTIANVGSSTEFSVTHPAYTSSQTGTYQANTAGPDCIKFEDTTPTGDPVMYVDPQIAVEEGSVYLIEAIVQATSIAGGNTVSIGVTWHDANGDYITVSWIHAAAVLPSASVWHRIAGVVTAPENARAAGLYISKANNAFFVFLDDFNGKEMPVLFVAEQTVATNIPHNTITDIAFDTEVKDYGGIFSTPTFTAPVSGIYQVSGTVEINKLTGFNGSGAYLYLNYNAGTRTYVVDRDQLLPGGQVSVLSCSTHMDLAAGDTLKLQAFHTDNQTLVTNGSYGTRFSVAKVE